MQTTRRVFLGAAGAAGAVAAAPRPARPAQCAVHAEAVHRSVTPCDKPLKFDDGIYKEMMPWFKQKGADGVVVLGTTGEYPSFSVAERKKVAETALKHRSGLAIIVQVGTTNFPETLDLLAHATANGADGVLCIPPFYYKKPPLEGLVKYYSMILEASKIPVHLYHIPGTSAVPISNELLHALEKYPNLAGIKDSNGDAAEYQSYVKEFPKLNMMTGTGNNLKAALQNGMGAILAEETSSPSTPPRYSPPPRRARIWRSPTTKYARNEYGYAAGRRRLLRPHEVRAQPADGNAPDVPASSASGRHRGAEGIDQEQADGTEARGIRHGRQILDIL